MTKLDPYEVLFEIKDGTEYATVHADAFRTAMRIRDELQAEAARLRRERAEVEHDLAAALLLNPFNDTRQILDLLTHALAIVQEPGSVNLHKKSWSP